MKIDDVDENKQGHLDDFFWQLNCKNLYQLRAYKISPMLIIESIVFLIKMQEIRKVYKEVNVCLNL